MEQTQSFKFMVTALLAAILVTLTGVSQVFGQPSHARIGVLTPGLTFASIQKGLQEGLARLGYKEGQNITFIVEDTLGSSVDLVPRVTKLLAAKPDMLFTVTTIHSLAAKRVTTTVPIVFAWASDPVAAGLIDSYASSKNNVTGVTNLDASLSGKRLEVFLELAPKVKRLLVLVASMQSAGHIALPSLETTAKKLGVQLVRRVVANREEIIRVLGEFSKGSVDAIYYLSSALMRTNIDLLIEKAKSDRIPMAVSDESLVERGALFSHGPSTRLIGLQAASLVDKVLKGTQPSEIVVETPNRFFLTVNLATAKMIGLKVPRTILERADRLIE